MKFRSTILVVPGLTNSGEQHWQTLWEKQFQFRRIHQRDWNSPVCEEWTSKLNEAVEQENAAQTILVGHSLGCITIAWWAVRYQTKIKAALLVAPSDTEAPTYPAGSQGFTPIPLQPLPFKSIVVASTNDPWVSMERAKQFAEAWQSDLITIGDAGHINTASGHGPWPTGLELLKQLD